MRTEDTNATRRGSGSNDLLGHVDAAVIDCWKANYCLEKTPHELYDYWQPESLPTGVVLALKAAVHALERAHACLEGYCTCPCCEGVRECLPGCTFAADAPTDAERMAGAREAMFGA